MRGRAERTDAQVLEEQLIAARVFARRLWLALKARSGLEAEALFAGDELRAADRVFDAVETIWERQRIAVVPCRRLADPSIGMSFMHAGPGPIEMYLGRWPDGTSRNLTRDQVLMMGGQDVEPVDDASSHVAEMAF